MSPTYYLRPATYRPDQACEHPSDAFGLVSQQFELNFVTEVPAENEVVAQLLQGALGDIVKANFIGRPPTLEPLCNVSWDGNASSLHLGNQPKSLILRQLLRHLVNIQDQVMRDLPYFQLFEPFDCHISLALPTLSQFPLPPATFNLRPAFAFRPPTTYDLPLPAFPSWNGHSLRTLARAMYAAVPTVKMTKAKISERAAAVART